LAELSMGELQSRPLFLYESGDETLTPAREESRDGSGHGPFTSTALRSHEGRVSLLDQ
jgi:hypothetical protein